ncbi:hypothetical protein ABJB81_001632 [Pseudomonas putida]|jgi:hypothetical protein|uniref:hypothetical protein n=1 Tax=unclassified Pseudomonas TaxID=196821 RepID=UPI0012E2CE76|nr:MULTISPECIES: hypothetical protein [unclassified Pseudomonas]
MPTHRLADRTNAITIQELADALPQLIGLDNSDKSASSKVVGKQRILTFLVKLPPLAGGAFSRHAE